MYYFKISVLLKKNHCFFLISIKNLEFIQKNAHFFLKSILFILEFSSLQRIPGSQMCKLGFFSSLIDKEDLLRFHHHNHFALRWVIDETL